MSFTTAADELGVTQSAVSQQTKHLEEYLGTSLFHRTSKGLQLTEAGSNYLPIVSEAFRLLEDGTLAYIDPEIKNTLKIEGNLSFSVLWLIPRIPAFLSEHPATKLQLSTILWSSEFQRIPTGVQIRFGRGNWAGLSATKLTDEAFYPVCSPEVARRIKRPQDLLHETLVEVTGVVSGWKTWFLEADVHVDRKLNLHLTNTYIISMELACKGCGIALGHDTISKAMVNQGQLAVPLDIRVPVPEGYYVLTAPERSLNKVTRDFLQWLRRNLASF